MIYTQIMYKINNDLLKKLLVIILNFGTMPTISAEEISRLCPLQGSGFSYFDWFLNQERQKHHPRRKFDAEYVDGRHADEHFAWCTNDPVSSSTQ